MMKKTIKLSQIFNIKKIASITKIFCKEYFQKIPAFADKDSKQGKLFKICAVIALFCLAYLSHHIINFLDKIGQPQIFLNIYLLIMAVIVIFQQILASINIYYFSKDLEYILPFPIKPIELLIGRFNMLVSISYITMILFAAVPLLIYGFIASTSLIYYPAMLIILIIFPIFFALIVSILMLFLMQLSKIIKNKEIFEFVVTTILMGILIIFEMQAFNSVLSNADEIKQIGQGETINLIEIINTKIIEINKYLLTINPSVKILIENNLLNNILNLIKLILINLISFILFIIIGKKLYLKNLLINIQKVNTSKIKEKNKKYKYKKINKNNSYIKNEFRELIKTPAFFMQCIFPIILILITLIIIAVTMKPTILEIMNIEEIAQEINKLKIDITVIISIVIIIQAIFSFSNLSITAISRKGKKAFFIKFIPISLYKQFIYLNIPQIFLNILITLVILGIAKYIVPSFTLLQIILIFIISLILNIINSFLMLVTDLRKPNLNWDNEIDAIKQNKNKLFQYVLTIIIILFLIYLAKIFENINLNLSLVLIILILFIILLIINKIIKIKLNKLFNKIN